MVMKYELLVYLAFLALVLLICQTFLIHLDEFICFFFQIHYVDSFKLFVPLYGHKLSILCMDISSDGDLIVTGSADKNIKIWGSKFGNIHKSIFAHADRYCIIFEAIIFFVIEISLESV